MEPLLFFLLGLPAAVAANHVILSLTRQDEDEAPPPAPDADDALALDVDAPERRLPWQSGAWPSRLRVTVCALIPVATAAAGWRFDPPQAAAVSLLLIALLICTATDLVRFRVPNVVTYPGIVLALAGAMLMPDADFVPALLAALGGGFVFLIMAVVTSGGLGLGDVKLAALIGAALGFPAAYQALVLGIASGGVVILVLFVAGVVSRRQAVPYAPFLALAAVAVVLLRGAAFAPL
jgi:prepilin signal peptidase PulO-like enzyme (type II secretory pathway)